MNVLVVDDEPSTVTLVASVVKKSGHEVTMAADGEQAWQLVRQKPVDLIVSDWMMPGLEGPELCRMVRKLAREKYVYIILLTSLSSRERFLEGMQAGADDFMRKPVDVEELNARLEAAQRILGLHQHVAQLEGLLAICSYCKKIRDDGGQWVQVESYMARRTQLEFSHGVCPICKAKVLEALKDGKPF